MLATQPLRDPIRAYLAVRLGLLSNRALISHAQDRLLDADVPTWIEELAFLRSNEILDAHRTLEQQLEKAGVLPDSEALRETIRAVVLEWADTVAASGRVELEDGVVPTVVRLFHLCPGYEHSSISIRVVEFPHPPSEIQSAVVLANYIRKHIREIVPTVSERRLG